MTRSSHRARITRRNFLHRSSTAALGFTAFALPAKPAIADIYPDQYLPALADRKL